VAAQLVASQEELRSIELGRIQSFSVLKWAMHM
jgi:hypothetical protein